MTNRNNCFFMSTQARLEELSPSNLYDKIYFSPSNDFTMELMESLRQDLEIIDERVEGVMNEDELRPIIDEKENFFAIVFHMDSEAVPKNLSYTIRSKNNNFRTNEIFNGDVFAANNRGR